MRIWIERTQDDYYFLHLNEPTFEAHASPAEWHSIKSGEYLGHSLAVSLLDFFNMAPPDRSNLLELEVNAKLIAHWKP